MMRSRRTKRGGRGGVALLVLTAVLISVPTARATPGTEFQWAAMGGILDYDVGPIYGPEGEFAPEHRPGARHGGVAWTDPTGGVWLFGGNGYYGAGAGAYLNDLWKFDPATGQWAWMRGTRTVSRAGVYGTQGVPDPLNNPPGRQDAATWTEASGALWLFGGGSSVPMYNDLWRYDSETDRWTWVKGANTRYQPGVYGTKGVPDSANTPGARQSAVTWSDTSGALWLFGGQGYDGEGNVGALNDLWKFDPATGNWTWMHGSDSVEQSGVYGTKGESASGNVPGARTCAVSWTDAAGAFWLFGGEGNAGVFNDLWMFDPTTGNWTWAHGSDSVDQPGVYGTKGEGDPANTPGARACAVSWADPSGAMWLLGGEGFDGEGDKGKLNDLWRYDPATGNWTWVKGGNTVDQRGTYGTQGEPDPANTPGARDQAIPWGDAEGRFWLLGGRGFDSRGFIHHLGDLWKYDPDAGDWTWVKGRDLYFQPGVYGTQGVAAPDNVPGGRTNGASWADAAGQLWLFGGQGFDGDANSGSLSDLWKYDPATGFWTWAKGPATVDHPGVNGTQGVPHPDNNPRARDRSVSWIDASGALWLFGGGIGWVDKIDFNDLWKFDPVTENWTWMKGDDTPNNPGTYGTQGVAAPDNIPGGRTGAVSWADASGGLWLFGGWGRDSQGLISFFNDLWKYDPATNNWTWMKGSDTPHQTGVYGIQGVADPANTPGARQTPVSWTDATGRFWLFGGWGYGTQETPGFLNDLWEYDPTTGNWTWMHGPETVNHAGIYGTQGLAAPNQLPGGRWDAVSWTDASGHFWLFGGWGYGTQETPKNLNELWKYDPITGNWVWMKGSDARAIPGVLETPLGVASAANTPGSRRRATVWTDPSGSMWLFGGYGIDCGNYFSNLGDLWRLAAPLSSVRHGAWLQME